MLQLKEEGLGSLRSVGQACRVKAGGTLVKWNPAGVAIWVGSRGSGLGTGHANAGLSGVCDSVHLTMVK